MIRMSSVTINDIWIKEWFKKRKKKRKWCCLMVILSSFYYPFVQISLLDKNVITTALFKTYGLTPTLGSRWKIYAAWSGHENRLFCADEVTDRFHNIIGEELADTWNINGLYLSTTALRWRLLWPYFASVPEALWHEVWDIDSAAFGRNYLVFGYHKSGNY